MKETKKFNGPVRQDNIKGQIFLLRFIWSRACTMSLSPPSHNWWTPSCWKQSVWRRQSQ